MLATGPKSSVLSSDAFLHGIATVRHAAGSIDHACKLLSGTLCVVRQVEIAKALDYAALSTMLAEGPFTRAILVYCDKEGSVLSDEIETWWIGDIEELAAKLAAEAEAGLP